MPGEKTAVTGSFTLYKDFQTRGFFLKAFWGSNLLAEQSDAYPPRLKVIKGTLEVINTYWKANGVLISSAEVGNEVEAHIVLRAVDGNFHGSVKIQIRKDLLLAPDVEYTYRTFSLTLPRGESKEFILTFTPDEASSLTLRGYFIEVDFDGESWTMESAYPPRLEVTEREVVSSTLEILDAYWMAGGEQVTSIEVGNEVEIWIHVKAVGGPFDGAVTIFIRKDLVAIPDVTFATFGDSLYLDKDESIWLRCRFAPDEASSLTLRGYFIELEFNGDSWTMESSYPPRLEVSEAVEEPVTETAGNPSVIDVWWTVGGVKVTEASVGSTVVAHVKIKASGGRLDGSIRVRIRKDIPLFPDEDYKVKTFDVSVGTGQTVELKVSFSPDEATSFTLRGYFVQVDLITWNDSWTMDDSYPPRLKVS